MSEPKYKRVLVKLSGEALRGQQKDGIFDFSMLDRIAASIKSCVDMGAEVALLVGAGNIWRGAKGVGMNRSCADSMGMLATMINTLALKDALTRAGVDAVATSSSEMGEYAELYRRDRAVEHLSHGQVVILGGGLGNPYFTTDSAAVLRALELDVDAAILAKNIDGVYDSDPRKNPDAVKLEQVSYSYIIDNRLGVIDLTAAELARENGLKILLCALEDPENIIRAVAGEKIGTIASDE